MIEYQGLYADNLAIHFLAVADRQIVAMAGAFIKSDIPYCFFRNPNYGFIGDVYTEAGRDLSSRRASHTKAYTYCALWP
jgi:hypothetical protein